MHDEVIACAGARDREHPVAGAQFGVACGRGCTRHDKAADRVLDPGARHCGRRHVAGQVDRQRLHAAADRTGTRGEVAVERGHRRRAVAARIENGAAGNQRRRTARHRQRIESQIAASSLQPRVTSRHQPADVEGTGHGEEDTLPGRRGTGEGRTWQHVQRCGECADTASPRIERNVHRLNRVRARAPDVENRPGSAQTHVAEREDLRHWQVARGRVEKHTRGRARGHRRGRLQREPDRVGRRADRATGRFQHHRLPGTARLDDRRTGRRHAVQVAVTLDADTRSGTHGLHVDVGLRTEKHVVQCVDGELAARQQLDIEIVALEHANHRRFDSNIIGLGCGEGDSLVGSESGRRARDQLFTVVAADPSGIRVQRDVAAPDVGRFDPGLGIGGLLEEHIATDRVLQFVFGPLEAVVLRQIVPLGLRQRIAVAGVVQPGNRGGDRPGGRETRLRQPRVRVVVGRSATRHPGRKLRRGQRGRLRGCRHVGIARVVGVGGVAGDRPAAVAYRLHVAQRPVAAVVGLPLTPDCADLGGEALIGIRPGEQHVVPQRRQGGLGSCVALFLGVAVDDRAGNGGQRHIAGD